jgi:hypothetical protein
MIRLDLKREPYWLDLVPGVRVRVRLCTTAMVMAARADVLGTSGNAGAITAALLKALAVAAIEDWEGVGYEDGQPATVTPEAVAAVMDIWPIAEAFERLYLGPAMVLDAEKND